MLCFLWLRICHTAWKVSQYGVFSCSEIYGVFNLNTGKYRGEKTQYLGPFHAVTNYVSSTLYVSSASFIFFLKDRKSFIVKFTHLVFYRRNDKSKWNLKNSTFQLKLLRAFYQEHCFKQSNIVCSIQPSSNSLKMLYLRLPLCIWIALSIQLLVYCRKGLVSMFSNLWKPLLTP